MVSEGVDIPRLRVGVYATAAKTPLIFRQIVGRFVRTLPGRPVEPSWLYVPADPVLRNHAATIEQELRRSLRRPGEADPFALDEREERRETERSDAPEFVPLNADVAPADDAVRRAGAGAAPGATVTGRGAMGRRHGRPSARRQRKRRRERPPAVPAFEQRARLRDERHRLVSEVRRRDGASHQEINAWLNRKLGISSVERATLAELEQSVELLMERLTRRR